MFRSFLILFSGSLFGQVVFTEIPLDKELVARDIATDSGYVSYFPALFNKIGSNPNYTSIEIDVQKSTDSSPYITIQY